ncbi:MAG: oligosaccharide repeat unit polymerase [Gammaproteobacteria bacterium]|nr:oligosaccharide repeat unit polymerase [Gammaproteobacteria bacterium]
MYTILFLSAVIIALVYLIYMQPASHRTIFEPGVIILGLFSLCYLAPALAIHIGANILSVDDIENVESISLYGLLFVVSFVFFYIATKIVRRVRVFPEVNISIGWSPGKCFIGVISTFLIIKTIFLYYGVGDSGDYAGQYFERASMPQAVRQAVNILSAIQWVLVYLLLATSISSSNLKYAMFFVWAAFFVYFVDMWITNSRSIFVMYSLVFIVTYMFYNRSIGLRKEIIYATLFITIMGLFAYKRANFDGEIDVNVIDILIPSEFIAIYQNALHLMSISGSSDFVQPPGSSYLQSLIAFIPKQINDEKWDLASWYVGEYFPGYAAQGGGLAFGIIPEALINWGIISIVFQAFIVSVVFRVSYVAACRTRSRSPNIWLLFYLFCISNIYNVIRSHSFSIFNGIALGFIVPFLILFLISRIRVAPRKL